jgi:hypothetical protein
MGVHEFAVLLQLGRNEEDEYAPLYRHASRGALIRIRGFAMTYRAHIFIIDTISLTYSALSSWLPSFRQVLI